MTTEEKLEATIALAANLDSNVRLLAVKIKGLHLALQQTLTLLELSEDDPRKTQFSKDLKALIIEAMDEPNAAEALDGPREILEMLGWPAKVS